MVHLIVMDLKLKMELSLTCFKNRIFNIVKENNIKYDDICITGSYVYNFINEFSDIDVIIFDYSLDKHKPLGVFYLDTLRIGIWIQPKEFINKKWSSNRYALPKYSIITNKIINEYSEDDIISYLTRFEQNKNWIDNRYYKDVFGTGINIIDKLKEKM